MSVRQLPKKWTTEDGQKFDTEAEAKAHDELYTAREAFKDAQKAYGRLLAERQKTADGFAFKWSFLSDFYFIHEPHGQMPSMGKISFYIHDTDISERDDCLELIGRSRWPNEPDRRVHYRIDELYAREANAQKALLAAKQRFVDECLADISKSLEAL